MCEHVIRLKVISIDEASNAIFNETVNVPRRSMKVLLLLFHEPYAAEVRNRKKIFNPILLRLRLL